MSLRSSFIPVPALVVLWIKSPRINVASFPNVFPVTSLIDAIFSRCFSGLAQMLVFHDGEARQPATLLKCK